MISPARRLKRAKAAARLLYLTVALLTYTMLRLQVGMVKIHWSQDAFVLELGMGETSPPMAGPGLAATAGERGGQSKQVARDKTRGEKERPKYPGRAASAEQKRQFGAALRAWKGKYPDDWKREEEARKRAAEGKEATTDELSALRRGREGSVPVEPGRRAAPGTGATYERLVQGEGRERADPPVANVTIWMYWDKGLAHLRSQTSGKYATDALCVEAWRTLYPEGGGDDGGGGRWEARLLDGAAARELAPAFAELWDHPHRKRLHAATLSDLLRVELLSRYGGVWADTSVCPTRRLEAWLPEALAAREGLLFQYMEPAAMTMPALKRFATCHEDEGISSQDARSIRTFFVAVSHPHNKIIDAWHEAQHEWMLRRANCDACQHGRYPYFISHCLLTVLRIKNPTLEAHFQRIFTADAAHPLPYQVCIVWEEDTWSFAKHRDTCSYYKKPQRNPALKKYIMSPEYMEDIRGLPKASNRPKSSNGSTTPHEARQTAAAKGAGGEGVAPRDAATLLFRPIDGPMAVAREEAQGHGRFCRPNYFTIGTRKGGTTSFHRYLIASHPGIFPFKLYALPVNRTASIAELKEDAQVGESLGFIGTEDFNAKFQHVPDGMLVGDSTVSRLVNDAETLARHCAASRLFALLRDPVERCHSQFLMRVRLRTHGLTDHANLTAAVTGQVRAFERHAAAHPDLARDPSPPVFGSMRSAANCLYEGVYVVHLRRLLDQGVDPASLRVYFSDDLFTHTEGVITDALAHLGLGAEDLDGAALSTPYNSGGGRKKKLAANLKFTPALERRMRRALAPFDAELVKFLGVERLPWYPGQP